jgi:dTDP-glucose 4,6-dehydratase
LNLVVTGAAGFIGSNFARAWFRDRGGRLGLLDSLTYAGSLDRIDHLVHAPDVSFFRIDVCDRDRVRWALEAVGADAVVHFAAESHVTRSESAPERFWRTNVEGTRVVLEEAARAGVGRVVHVSTDEVYGPVVVGAFREEDKEPGTAQASSAYAKSKSAADDLVLQLASVVPVVVVRPTNCFGPWQHPEKALPRWITRALMGRSLPVWGDGRYVRQWLHVDDLSAAIRMVLDMDRPGPVYNIGPRHEAEITNLELARWIGDHLGLPSERVSLTAYDRPGHDRRYAVDPSRIEAAGWQPGDRWERFASTVEWYRANTAWWLPLLPDAESLYRDGPLAAAVGESAAAGGRA